MLVRNTRVPILVGRRPYPYVGCHEKSAISKLTMEDRIAAHFEWRIQKKVCDATYREVNVC